MTDSDGQPLPGRSFRVVLLTTFATFCALYAPQPLLPLFADTFGTSPARAALLLTVVFVFLAIAPLLYGAVLRRLSAQRLLVIASASLGILQFAFAAAPSINALIGARVLQGMLFPAIFTAAVTYCSRAGEPRAIARRVAIYVATTILGGLSGRLIGGFGGDLIGWRATFVALGILLLVCAVLLRSVARDARVASSTSSLTASLAILIRREFAAGFVLIFLVFLVFTGLLNALPFRLIELDPGLSASDISLVYLGYLIGIAIALNVDRLNRASGGPVRTIGYAIVVFTLGVAAMSRATPTALVVIGFLTSGGMFTVHATLSGFLNGLQPEEASLVNGLYIAIYYAAGAVGSVLPLWLYTQAGWSIFIVGMLVLLIATALPWILLQRHSSTTNP